MKKHAYLILAHNEFDVLRLLVEALDDPRNELFIHFDRKLEALPALHTRYAGLTILSRRIDVRWGDVSMLEAEYSLFEEAYRCAEYAYYHLISGVDLPIKSQDYIHRFFEEHSGKEFIGYYQGNVDEIVKRRICYIHLFPKHFRETFGLMNRVRKIIRAAFLRFQIGLNIRRYSDNELSMFKKGTQWISVTHAFVTYMLTRKTELLHRYRNTFCCDELFAQTLCWNSPFRRNLYNITDEGQGCLRFINWKNNRLYPYTEEDFDVLMHNNALFARKFSGEHIEIARKIVITKHSDSRFFEKV